MKTNILLLAVLLSMSICFINCDSKSPAKVVNYPSITNTTIPTACLFAENRNGVNVTRINAECADTLIRNYQSEVEALKLQNPNIDDLLSYGAQVDIASLTVIMNTINSEGYDEVYTMMAAVPGKRSSVIFVLKNKATDERAYYNFTQPCPDYCPGSLN